jgi:hypothetical protein
MSAEGRARIAAAQRARWAKAKKAQKPQDYTPRDLALGPDGATALSPQASRAQQKQARGNEL